MSHARDEEIQFLSQFLQLNPRSRISAAQAFSLPYFTDELPRPSDHQDLCHFKLFFNETKKRLQGGRKDEISCVEDYLMLVQNMLTSES
ncbi:hypothetical protein EON65_23640 [archaeon]|nr:MAG: hypothetical protein EON65_23640 [archaeon]